MFMNVKRSGEGSFRKYDAEYTSLDVRRKLENEFLEMTLDDKIEIVIKNDRDGADGAKSRFVYAGVLASLFTTPPGVAWSIREADTDEWMDYILQLKRIDRSLCPKFYNMSCDVLYWPSTKNPTVDFYYKTKEDNLVAFQITTKQNEVNSV